MNKEGGTSKEIDYPEGTYVESDTPQSKQKYKGWY